ncbi:PH domain-containing protein [Bacillus cereus group sp. BfR-BA-01352]|uniref:PH domain-containing protein n=1 Tax=Bacillus cereus group sp. BfR-BA-01352 TaxID=2920315 RepID=UPI001F586B45|nr:PH domain-containing protein [Bacillus cereus group sp. BfR-BA-01352]
MIFKAKKGPIISSLIWLLIVACCTLPILKYLGFKHIYIRIAGIKSYDNLLITLICFSILIFLLLIWFRTFYVLTGHTLIIKSGIFKWSIPINSIEMIIATKNYTAAPALSTDRLQIVDNNTKSILISPKDRELFIKHIKKVNEKVNVLV